MMPKILLKHKEGWTGNSFTKYGYQNTVLITWFKKIFSYINSKKEQLFIIISSYMALHVVFSFL